MLSRHYGIGMGRGPISDKRSMHSNDLTQVSYTAGTSNAVNIFLNVTWKIKVDDVFDMRNVQSTSSHLFEYIIKITHSPTHLIRITISDTDMDSILEF